MNDTEYLNQAIALAGQSGEPIKCACLLVRNGAIIASAFNSQREDKIAVHHAEVKAVIAANRSTGKRKLKGAVAYCSCEPCVMCLGALSLAGIERIVYCETMKDVAPNDPMSRLDSADFAQQYLNFVPKLERIIV